MDIGLLPQEHLHKLLGETTPALAYQKGEEYTAWKKRAYEKLYGLLGLDKIEPYRCETALEIEFDRISREEGFREIRFRIQTEQDVTVPCHLVLPMNATEPLPVAICLQGHSKGMHISLGRPIYPGDEETCHGGDRDFAARCVKEGIAAVAVEQRCFGECGGTPKGPDCRQAAMRALLLGRTLVGERVWDIMRVIDTLIASFSHLVDGDKIICMGNSGGGTATVYASAMDERIRIAVPSCAVSTFADSIGAMLHCECNFIPHIAESFDMGELCAMIAPRPLIVVSGHDDPIFPLDGAKKCVSVATEVYRSAGVEDYPVHVIGNGAHRFYADDTWPHLHTAIRSL